MEQHIYLEEALKIADKLEEMSKRDDRGHIYWESWREVGDELVSRPGTSLYFDNAGISLFFYELYRQTKNDRYLNILTDNLNWILRDPSLYEPKNVSLYFGSLGASFILAKCATLLNDQDLLHKSLDIALRIGPVLDTEYMQNTNDLLKGISGILYGLTGLYHISQSNEILDLIKRCIDHLVDNCHFTRKGIYWDREYNQVKGLCGMSHGVSGIATVLLEVGHYFNNETLKNIAFFAFDYENSYYDQNQNNWRDLRIGAYSMEYYEYYRQSYLNNQKENFYRTQYMNAWCHGAPGVGLSRVRAIELTAARVYIRDLHRAIRKCSTASYLTHESLTLCHGLGGIIDLYLEASHVLKDKRLRLLANKTFSDFITFKSADKYKSGFEDHYEIDTSLFNGIAGIGHLCLRLHSPSTVQSILTPALNVPGPSSQNDRLAYLTPAYVINRTVKKRFPKTVNLLETVNITDDPSVNFIFNRHELAFRDIFSPRLTEPITGDETREITICIKSLFRLEKQGHVLDTETDNHLYYWIKHKVNNELLKELAEEAIWTSTVKSDPALRMINATMPQKESETNGTFKIDKRVIILQARYDGVKELFPGKLAFLLIKTLPHETVVKTHFEIVKGYFPQGSDDAFLQNTYLEQLKELIRHGLILLA